MSVTLRFPRDLYEQAQHHAQQRRTTLTELVLEGVRLRLETPIDPRDILVSQDNTVMQELRQMIADEVQAALAAQHFQAPESAPARQAEDNSKAQHYSNAREQVYEPEHGHSLVTEPSPSVPARHGRKLTPRQIRCAEDKHLRGVTVPALMDEYGISRVCVSLSPE